MIERRGDRDLHAELVGLVRLALADAFDLRRVQGINLLAALALALMTHRIGERQQLGEGARLPSSPLILRMMSRITRPR